MWAVLLAGFFAPTAAAEGPGLSLQRVDVSQFPTIRTYVSVANSSGVPITGLDAQAFVIQEDGKPVDAISVEPVVDSQEPIAIIVAVDTSGSMAAQDKIAHARDAASAFVDALGPNDRLSIVAFATDVRVVQEPTPDRAALKEAIGGLAAKGDTRLYDAVAEASRRQAGQTVRRKVLLVLSDGEDTKSDANLENAIAAATGASSPVYAIGLGSEVKKDVLDKLATATGGQSVYVDDPAQLRTTFLSISDQLRRQYVLRYTSRLAPDDKPHGLAVQVQYSGVQVTGLRSFTLPAPPAPPTITGLPVAGPVSGPLRVTVDVPGGAQSVELLVDDQPRGATRTPPFVLDWDTGRENAGPHRVIVRITDAQGAPSDRPFSVTVAAPPPTREIAAPATPVAPAPTAVPQPTPTTGPAPRGLDSVLAVGLLLLLLVGGIAAWFLTNRPRSEHAPPPPRPTVGERSDQTEIVGKSSDEADKTFVRAEPPRRPPRARLVIARRGEEREIVLDQSELTVGRDTSTGVAIDDPLASRQHCRIVREDGQFWIEDLRSLNGTQVNGETVNKRQLASSDRISIGETVLTFVLDPR